MLEPEALEALQFFSDLHFTHQVAVPPPTGQYLEFWKGTVAIWDSASWNISYNRQYAQPFVDWDIVPALRSPRTGNPAPLVSGHIAAISSTSQNPAMAWQFIKFMFLDDNGQKGVADEGMLPTRKSFASYYVRRTTAPPQNIQPVLQAAQEGRTPIWFNDPQVNKDVYQIIATEWNKVMAQQQAVQAFAEIVTPLINAKLQAMNR